MTYISLIDLAKLKNNGYTVASEGPRMGWVLTHSSDTTGYLMIGNHGCVSPTKWEAVAEALSRIEQDERLS